VIELDPRRTIIIGILVLFLGKYLNDRISLFRRYNLPEPVTGGIVASVAFGVFHWIFSIDLQFSDHSRDLLLVVFFTSIGLSTEFRNIIKGGKPLFRLSALAIGYLFIQNFAGILVACLAGMDLAAGILTGAAALQGGHGNIVAWAPVLEGTYGVANAMEIGMITATFGLIFGGILGGPVAGYLIKKHGLEMDHASDVTIGAKLGEKLTIDRNSMLKILLMLSVSIGMGLYLNDLATHFGFTLPLFVTCMFSGVVLANTVPLIFPNISCPSGSPTLAVISELSLGLFLAMAMMGLRFWEVGSQSLLIFASLLIQVVLITLFAVFIVFRVLGKNYDAAVITAGYLGSALGATPTAMANMAAVTQKFGASPIAFMVIPIVAAFIIQISNAVVIQLILNIIT
jgi:ESS family glutamate:Na+ symporter